MIRDINIDEISDGNRYTSRDMVRVGCNDCAGCSKCCRDMGKSIILDPYDVFNICTALGKSFDELIDTDEAVIELSIVDGLLLPNLRMNTVGNCCNLLSEDGRCTIHDSRPGFCRLFPLGRIYEDGGFSYFNQIYECDYPNKSKVKIKNWLGIDNLSQYERFVLKWHDYMDTLRRELSDLEDTNAVSRFWVIILKKFYREPYDTNRPFFEQIEERMG